MREIVNFNEWIIWLRSQDVAWLFLAILAFVIGVVVFWSKGLRSGGRNDSEPD